MEEKPRLFLRYPVYWTIFAASVAYANRSEMELTWKLLFILWCGSFILAFSLIRFNEHIYYCAKHKGIDRVGVWKYVSICMSLSCWYLMRKRLQDELSHDVKVAQAAAHITAHYLKLTRYRSQLDSAISLLDLSLNANASIKQLSNQGIFFNG